MKEVREIIFEILPISDNNVLFNEFLKITLSSSWVSKSKYQISNFYTETQLLDLKSCEKILMYRYATKEKTTREKAAHMCDWLIRNQINTKFKDEETYRKTFCNVLTKYPYLITQYISLDLVYNHMGNISIGFLNIRCKEAFNFFEKNISIAEKHKGYRTKLEKQSEKEEKPTNELTKKNEIYLESAEEIKEQLRKAIANG